MRILLIMLTVVIAACNVNPDKNTPRFGLIKATDSTSYIQWTDGEKTFRSENTIDNYYVDEKTYIRWKNDAFLCLRHSNGSDTWTDILLSLSQPEYRMFENALEYDKDNGIAVCETDSLNYKLVAENISSGEKQFIGADWENCSAAFPHYCIESIRFQDKILFVEWVTPNKTDSLSKEALKEIKLNI